MDPANLSYAHIVGALASSLLFAGIGMAIGWRLLPLTKLYRDARSPNGEAESFTAIDPTASNGRLFPTDILGLDGDVIRYRDGSFGRAYRFEPAATLYDDGQFTEQRIDDLKTILKFERPKGTIIQFRFCSKADDGRVLKDHIRSRNVEKSDPLASMLQATNLSIHEEA